MSPLTGSGEYVDSAEVIEVCNPMDWALVFEKTAGNVPQRPVPDVLGSASF